jgi:hypothetical protein
MACCKARLAAWIHNTVVAEYSVDGVRCVKGAHVLQSFHDLPLHFDIIRVYIIKQVCVDKHEARGNSGALMRIQ